MPFVYACTLDYGIKIGKADNFELRKKGLQTSNNKEIQLICLLQVDDAFQYEKIIHLCLDKYRPSKREIFICDTQLIIDTFSLIKQQFELTISYPPDNNVLNIGHCEIIASENNLKQKQIAFKEAELDNKIKKQQEKEQERLRKEERELTKLEEIKKEKELKDNNDELGIFLNDCVIIDINNKVRFLDIIKHFTRSKGKISNIEKNKIKELIPQRLNTKVIKRANVEWIDGFKIIR